MGERIIQKLSLVGQVVEDLNFNVIKHPRFRVQLLRKNNSPNSVAIISNHSPQYKSDGFFVFSNLSNDEYTLRIQATSFQTLYYPFSIPFQWTNSIIKSSGDNELIVVVKDIVPSKNKVTFEPIILSKEIEKHSIVISNNLETKLSERLEIGKRESALLSSVNNLSVGSIIRIIRGNSLRLKFNPYFTHQNGVTNIIGKVVSSTNNELPLKGVKIQLKKINDGAITWIDLEGVNIAVAEVGGNKMVLGSEKDLITFSNNNGYYGFYFDRWKFIDLNNNNDLLNKITLEVSLEGYKEVVHEEALKSGERKTLNFQLIKNVI